MDLPRCPEGHILPNKTDSGNCTGLFCAEPGDGAPPESALVPPERRAPNVDYSGDAEQKYVDKALVRESIRAKALGTPKNLTGAAAERFVEDKLVELSVPAVMELAGRLRFGDDDQRYKAAKDVLAATGHGPRDAANLGGALIVIQANGGAEAKVSRWRRKKGAPPSEQVVDGAVKSDA